MKVRVVEEEAWKRGWIWAGGLWAGWFVEGDNGSCYSHRRRGLSAMLVAEGV